MGYSYGAMFTKFDFLSERPGYTPVHLCYGCSLIREQPDGVYPTSFCEILLILYFLLDFLTGCSTNKFL
jgi:hypothetical protein